MSVTNANRPENGVPSSISGIPLTKVDAPTPRDASVGELVRDAATQLSTLFRAEVQLAKAEVTGEVKKGVQGSLFFILALAVLTFSSFFFFFFLAELLDVLVARWLAFLIVFLIMLVVTGLLALIGYMRVRKLRAPNKTIDSLKQTASILPSSQDGHDADGPRHAAPRHATR